MIETLVASNLLLWCLNIVLIIAVFALARQVGVLSERVAPAGALMPTSGPKVGEAAAQLEVETLDGKTFHIGSTADRPSLILFVSPTCPVCRSLVPTAKSLARAEDLSLVFASDGDTREQHAKYAEELDLDRYPYVLSQTLGVSYGVSKLPFAVLIDAQGVLAGKGLVNTREHLESLVEAMQSGVATLQEFVQDLEPARRDAVKEYAP
jgi:methylamine dehydrogenase accessory protein MauD